MVDWDEQQEPTIAGLGVGGQLSGSTRHHVRNTPTNLNYPLYPPNYQNMAKERMEGEALILCSERNLHHAVMTNIIIVKGDNF